MTAAEVREARVVGLLKNTHGADDLTAEGTAVDVDVQSPVYDTLDGMVVVCHYECVVHQAYQPEKRVAGDIVVEDGRLSVRELLVDNEPADNKQG